MSPSQKEPGVQESPSIREEGWKELKILLGDINADEEVAVAKE